MYDGEKIMLKKLSGSIVIKYIHRLVYRYKEDELAPMSAQITYYLILAFFPFLFFLINLLSFTHLSNRLLIMNLNTILPTDTTVMVKNLLSQTAQDQSTTLMVLGMIGSLWAASQGMFAIIRGLNKSYGVKESRHFVKLTLIALASTVALTFIIIFSFFLIVFGRNFGYYAFGLMGEKALFHSIWPFIRYGISFTLVFITFYLIYMYLPNRKLNFKNIIKGTAFAAVGWVCVSLLFSYYVNSYAIYQKIYGSLGGIFALIIWLYISTLVFMLGGELNAVSSQFDEEKQVQTRRNRFML